jgi:hypothetical protein
MDADRLDDMVRSLTEGATRRGIARALGGLSLTGIVCARSPLVAKVTSGGTPAASRRRRKRGEGVER